MLKYSLAIKKLIDLVKYTYLQLESGPNAYLSLSYEVATSVYCSDADMSARK
jgi:hypothetical protein